MLSATGYPSVLDSPKSMVLHRGVLVDPYLESPNKRPLAWILHAAIALAFKSNLRRKGSVYL